MSPVLQPPWPLQLFIPLQSCLLSDASDDEETVLPEVSEELWHPVVAIVPATNPAIAAETINVLAVRVILFPGFVFINCSMNERSRKRIGCIPFIQLCHNDANLWA
jgi:hypothetical protein